MLGRVVSGRPLLASERGARALVRVRASEVDAPKSNLPDASPKVYRNIGPEPKRFTVGDGQMMEIATASLPVVLRLGMGAMNMGYKVALAQDDDKYAVARVGGQKVSETSDVGKYRRPNQPLELYEFEGCPFCKKAREAVTLLDLDVIIRPCPKEGTTWRPQAIAMGGKKMFPFLVDPNTGKQMYESDDIVKYLFNEYGPGEAEIPFMLRAGLLTTLTCGLGMAARGGRGNTARKSRQPEKPLIMWMYEGSPFVKLVREVLCELELPYLQKTAARGSPKRQQLIDTYGHFQVPFMEDPNTGVCSFESKAIIEYLEKEYGSA